LNSLIFINILIIGNPKLYCVHPSYPCYYYTCTQVALGLDLINTPAYKCSNGFIFDEITQSCSQTFPFKSCNEDELSKRIKVLNEHEIGNNEENVMSKESRKEFLLRVLKNFGRSSHHHASLPSNSSYQSETNKLNLTYITTHENKSEVFFHEDLEHTFTNSNNTNNTSIEQDDHKYQNDNDAYAFIIVPVKVPNKDIQKSLNGKKSKPETVLAPKNNVDDRNLKSFQSIGLFSFIFF
jgi:hypothetical protein